MDGRRACACGRDVVTFDLSSEPRRLGLLLDELDGFTHVAGDITDGDAVERALADLTHVIHLAALQVPFVRADPPLGARVNVLGTVNVFEAAKRRGIRVVYASSIAALDGAGTLDGAPTTLYGAFKRTNEHTAAVYFGQGKTSAPTVATLAAAAGRPYTIPYGGSCQMQFARDVAHAFIAADSDAPGASVHNLPGRRGSVDEIVAAIGSDLIGHHDLLLPFPEEVDGASFATVVPNFTETPLDEGVRVTVDRFRTLLADGKVAHE